jgi:hypothetical protein
MAVLDWYGLAGMAAISLIFYAVRRVPRYIFACALVILAFGWATRDFLLRTPVQWIVMCAGLCLAVFGLLIVRVMLTRSVSLHLLRRLQASLNDEFTRDIGSRLDDMRGFGLIRDVEGEKVMLTTFGQFIGSVVAVLYTAFKIKG